MRKKFVKNLIFLVFINLLIKPFWIFGIDREVQNIVGAEDYGFYFALFNFSMLLNILLDFGLTNFNNRNIAQHNQLLSKHLSNIVVLKFGLGFIYAFVTLVSAFFIEYNWLQIKVLMFLIFNQFLLSFILYLRSNLAGLLLFRTDSILSVLDRLLLIVICSILLWTNIFGGEFQIEWFVYAQTVSYSITAIIAFYQVLSKSEFIKLRFDPTFFIVILKYSYPFALLTLLMSFYNRIDSVMLERLLPNGKEQAGIYAQSFRILEAASMFAFLFASLLLPLFSNLIKKKQLSEVNKLTKLSFLLVTVCSVSLSVACFCYRNEIMDFLYHQHIKASADIFGFLILGFISIATTYIFGTLLTANGNLKKLNIMASFGMIINIVLNIILIPKYQALGAAISSFVTQSFTALVQVIIAQRQFRFRVDFKLISLLIVYTVSIYGVGRFTLENISNWFLGFVLTGGVGVILAFILRFFKIKEILLLVKKRKNEVE